LSALRALRRNICERPSCLQQVDARELRAARSQAAQALRQSQIDSLGAERAGLLRVLWIFPHEARLVELSSELREAQVAYLEGLADAADDVAPADPAPDSGPLQRSAAQLCGWCAGRCCRTGGQHHAYITASHLRRWQRDHPGSSLHEAAAAYIERLPQRHVEGSCFHHGERGCTLDRDMRSSICNEFACDGLRDVQLQSAKAPQTEWLFAMGNRADFEALALATTAGLKPLDPTPRS
jgi:hypothetical protein